MCSRQRDMERVSELRHGSKRFTDKTHRKAVQSLLFAEVRGQPHTLIISERITRQTERAAQPNKSQGKMSSNFDITLWEDEGVGACKRGNLNAQSDRFIGINLV